MSWVDLYWLPLGAGGSVVKFNGHAFEAVEAALKRRKRLDLYHSALEVRLPEGRYVIEIAPVHNQDGPDRGVVGEAPVGSRWAGSLEIFRYELRCWEHGTLPDREEAVDSPVRVSSEEEVARRIIGLLPSVPMPVWGRDELKTGEMWNSNSVISWLLARAGLPMESIRPPVGGRAPGWDAGLVVAGGSADSSGHRP